MSPSSPTTLRTTRGTSPYSQGVKKSATSSAAESGILEDAHRLREGRILVAALARLPQEEKEGHREPDPDEDVQRDDTLMLLQEASEGVPVGGEPSRARAGTSPSVPARRASPRGARRRGPAAADPCPRGPWRCGPARLQRRGLLRDALLELQHLRALRLDRALGGGDGGEAGVHAREHGGGRGGAPRLRAGGLPGGPERDQLAQVALELGGEPRELIRPPGERAARGQEGAGEIVEEGAARPVRERARHRLRADAQILAEGGKPPLDL